MSLKDDCNQTTGNRRIAVLEQINIAQSQASITVHNSPTSQNQTNIHSSQITVV